MEALRLGVSRAIEGLLEDEMYKAYVRELFRKAAGASWRAANGLMGGALAGVALVWPGVLSIFSNAKWWTQAANWLLSFVLYALVAWLALFLLHLMFIAPYLCWKSLAEKARTPDDGARRREVVDHDKKLPPESVICSPKITNRN
jgi:hypothetical protein